MWESVSTLWKHGIFSYGNFINNKNIYVYKLSLITINRCININILFIMDGYTVVLEFKCNSNNKYYNSSYFVLVVGIWQWDKSVVVRTVVLL